ncbi:hypothetical protein QBC38DRAFT_171373 [Podospora fimiseda]|uniref:Uncharacterized protein n=1 Tax=Podospora fimiseda TaxID=252190 RepID=A0AAN7GZX4_9PEZI|nr:hypothetical protein QBC38DRAFT_171373 [Podospora fimiseda]
MVKLKQTSMLLLSLFLSSSCAWASPSPSPAAHPNPPQPTITEYVHIIARQDPNPQIQQLSSQLSTLSQSSRAVSQASQELSQSSLQLSIQSQQLSNRLSQTELQLASARAQINAVEQGSRGVSQQAAEASRRVDETRRSAEQAMRQMSESMTRMMSERERQMSESASRERASLSSVLASVVRVQVTGTGMVGVRESATGRVEEEEGDKDKDNSVQTALGIVGGVIGGILLGVAGGWGVWWLRRRRRGDGEGSKKSGGITIGFPELKSTSNRAYASVGLGGKEKGVRDSGSSFYSTDYEKGGMGMGMFGDIKMPVSPVKAALDAPDLRALKMMDEMNRTKTLSRKSVGGGPGMKQVKEDGEKQPSMPGLAMSYYGEEKQQQTPIATAMVTIPAKGIGSNSNSSKDGGKFQLGNPPPPRGVGGGKFTLFPKTSEGDFSNPLGTASTVGSGKRSSSGLPSLDTWLRNGVGTVSPFGVVKKGTP